MIKEYEDGVRIRPFTPDDRERVLAFLQQMGPETRGFFDRDGASSAKFKSYFNQTAQNKAFFMAEYNGEMIGSFLFWDTHKSIPWLGIVVHEQWKNKKIGTRLMAYAKETAQKMGKGGILLTTHQANLRGQVLYEHSGYEYLGNHKSGEVLYLLRFDQ